MRTRAVLKVVSNVSKEPLVSTTAVKTSNLIKIGNEYLSGLRIISNYILCYIAHALTCSQETTTDTYPEPTESSPHPPRYFYNQIRQLFCVRETGTSLYNSSLIVLLCGFFMY
jgi:hypothetical protein